MGDPELVYSLEVRIIDLEKKVEQLEALANKGSSDTPPLPKSVIARIESGEHPVRVLREYRALTQKQLGETCGLWPNHISSIERGQSFSLKTARKLSEGLSVSPRLLMSHMK